MIITNFLVKKRKISQIDSVPYTGEDNIDTFKFEFDEEWEGLDKTLVIVSGSHRYNIALLHDQCVVPFEFYQIKGNVLIGLFGTDGTYQTLATGWLPIYVEEDSYEVGVEPDNLPSQTQWDAFVTEINNLLEQAEASEEHCAEILAQMQEDYETYLGQLNQIKEDTEELKNQTQTIKNDTNQIKTDVQGLKRQIEQDIADAELRIDEYNANAQAKTNEFNNNYNTKLGSFNDNATSKTNAFNSNAESKTNTFNQNVTDKTTTFNNNATQKTTAFNDNATSKTSTFNQNAQEKMNAVIQAGTTAIDNIEDAEDTAIEHIQDAGASYDERLSDLELLKTNLNTAKVKGDNIHITDSLNAKPEMIVVKGNTTQETTTGAQLYNVSDQKDVSSGITVDSEDWITATYNNSSGSSIQYFNYFTNNLDMELSTRYLVVAEIKNVSGSGTIVFAGNPCQFEYGESKAFSELSNNSKILFSRVTKSSYSGVNSGLRTYIQFAAGQSGSITFRLSILADTTVTPSTFTYEPYTGEQPSPSPSYPQNIVDVTGTQTIYNSNKNLFNTENISPSPAAGVSITAINDNELIVSNNIAGTYRYGNVTISGLKKNTNYTFRAKYINSNSNVTTLWLSIVNEALTATIYNNSYTSNQAITFNSGNETTVIIRPHCTTNSATNSATWYDIQLEEGSTATDFEYHKGSSNQLRLGDIYLGDLDNGVENLLFKNVEREDNPYYDSALEKNKWYWLKQGYSKQIFDGTEEWSERTNQRGVKQFSVKTSFSNVVANNKQKCNYGRYYFYTYNQGVYGNFMVADNDGKFFICVDDNETLANWKSKLAQNNLTVIVPISVPGKILITDENLLEDLANIEENMRTYKNITEIYCVSNSGGNAPVLDLTYLKDDRVEINSRLDALEEAIVAQNS